MSNSFRCMPLIVGMALLPGLSWAVDNSANDFGLTGVWQTPSARMNEPGEITLHYSHTDPYTRLNVMLQPFSWLQGGFRYIDVSNRNYATSTTGQSYKDKGIDVKFRLLEESPRLPALSLGLQDLGGTGLFAGEYVVASKRFNNLDVSAGLGWGYVGARGDFGNPLSLISSSADKRPQNSGTGDINLTQFFRGRTSPFLGVQYQRPGSPLIVKAEYEGNDYQSEPQNNNQRQTSPVNLGVVWQVRPFMDLQLALERGNTAMLGLTFHTNLAKTKAQVRRYDPAPEPVRLDLPEVSTPVMSPDALQAWVPALEAQAGLQVSDLSVRGDEVIVKAESTRYLHSAEAADRVARVLDQRTPAEIRWFTLQQEMYGLRQLDATIDRNLWRLTQTQPTTPAEQATAIQADPPAFQTPETADTYQPMPLKRVSGGFGLGYQQSVGGPDGFLLYQLSINAEGEYRLRPNVWASGQANYRFLDNYQDFTYTGPSLLPRVRTFLREYLTTSEVTLPNAQLTATTTLAPGWYALGYGGLLESMYAGVGGEVLYRPFGKALALGVDLNYLQQRDFAQDFGLRDYKTLTGHASAYWRTGWQGVLATVKVGRYLAKDLGVTLDMSRQFANGVEMGAYATVTDAGSKFGEGSFDKGIYVRVPFDLFLPKATRSVASLNWQPLTRDGGAMLNRRYTLFDLTAQRDTALFKAPQAAP